MPENTCDRARKIYMKSEKSLVPASLSNVQSHLSISCFVGIPLSCCSQISHALYYEASSKKFAKMWDLAFHLQLHIIQSYHLCTNERACDLTLVHYFLHIMDWTCNNHHHRMSQNCMFWIHYVMLLKLFKCPFKLWRQKKFFQAMNIYNYNNSAVELID